MRRFAEIDWKRYLWRGSSTGASTWPKTNDVRVLGGAQGKTAAAELMRVRKRKKRLLASGVYRRVGAWVWIVGKELPFRERPSGCRNYCWAVEVAAVVGADAIGTIEVVKLATDGLNQ